MYRGIQSNGFQYHGQRQMSDFSDVCCARLGTVGVWTSLHPDSIALPSFKRFTAFVNVASRFVLIQLAVRTIIFYFHKSQLPVAKDLLWLFAHSSWWVTLCTVKWKCLRTLRIRSRWQKKVIWIQRRTFGISDMSIVGFALIRRSGRNSFSSLHTASGINCSLYQ